ncbi:MAG: hypothetical protein RR744_00450 [Cellulosilyticaceae bacterium]
MIKFKKEDYGFVTDVPAVVDGKRLSGYDTWIGMIQRCYNKRSPNYKYYGGKGVVISQEWRLFSAFKAFYDRENPNGKLNIDKDILGAGEYSEKSVVLISKEENSRIMATGKIGDLNSMAKPKEYYSVNTSFRHSFKKICKNRGWNFEDFNEIFSGEISNNYQKRFYYIEIMGGNDEVCKD